MTQCEREASGDTGLLQAAGVHGRAHPCGILLANPKSAMRMCPEASKRMFSGFRSRYTMF